VQRVQVQRVLGRAFEYDPIDGEDTSMTDIVYGPEPMKSPGVAAVLSAIIPGIGQFYNGDFLRGIFWLIITPGFWIGSGGLLGWVCHVIAAITAYHRAKRTRRFT
jgi:TM2 domain-containing membrane protein YozV